MCGVFVEEELQVNSIIALHFLISNMMLTVPGTRRVCRAPTRVALFCTAYVSLPEDTWILGTGKSMRQLQCQVW